MRMRNVYLGYCLLLKSLRNLSTSGIRAVKTIPACIFFVSAATWACSARGAIPVGQAVTDGNKTPPVHMKQENILPCSVKWQIIIDAAKKTQSDSGLGSAPFLKAEPSNRKDVGVNPIVYDSISRIAHLLYAKLPHQLSRHQLIAASVEAAYLWEDAYQTVLMAPVGLSSNESLSDARAQAEAETMRGNGCPVKIKVEISPKK